MATRASRRVRSQGTCCVLVVGVARPSPAAQGVRGCGTPFAKPQGVPHAWHSRPLAPALGGLLLGLGLLLAPRPAYGVILRLTPLKDVLEESNFVFVAKVDAVDAKRPAMVLALDRHLKGKAPFTKLPVHLKGDAVAAKGKETEA